MSQVREEKIGVCELTCSIVYEGWPTIHSDCQTLYYVTWTCGVNVTYDRVVVVSPLGVSASRDAVYSYISTALRDNLCNLHIAIFNLQNTGSLPATIIQIGDSHIMYLQIENG